MANFFFYGTLCEPEIAREILGRPLSGCSPRPGILSGYKRVYVSDATYPAVVPDDEHAVDGLLVKRISALEASRLSRYEGPQYHVQEVEISLKDGTHDQARIFLPKPALQLSDRLWDLETWRRQEKKRFMAGLKRNVLI
ncbi:gamma-glutamylcyclotransferase family protein [Thalassospiraceae bacterium LMO-JJ14]|nr:gamma-glutamylcyclotransferase family protein [Thalassospiraceae bacterium LMO-JJ14]